ncbi:hypothetical protein [Rivibacter subsaxonicus]|uniref:Uncharacterized protein n=1 Tax=Rivibacter subsaxonicus TaxID=457575 RepID=A0A4Q7VGW9_9BURK|nr:hypothetical protein [Rivibacter subsaxonicus]RZT95302.1 hypothetical protein EV670_3055 [Rivibacter subsaxonicus]
MRVRNEEILAAFPPVGVRIDLLDLLKKLPQVPDRLNLNPHLRKLVDRGYIERVYVGCYARLPPKRPGK